MNGFDDVAFNQQSKDIREAALECGFAIAENGTNRKMTGKILGARFKCIFQFFFCIQKSCLVSSLVVLFLEFFNI